MLYSNGDETFSWKTITEDDPQVGSLTTNYVPKWNGASLVNGLIYDDGTYVAIGTTSVYAKLTVSGFKDTYYNYGFLNNTGSTGTDSGTCHYSIYGSDRIACQEFNAFSDIRIKSILGISDSASDLETLMQLKITDYTYIDTISKGNQVHKKLIAQDGEKIYPKGVSSLIAVIPSIYTLSESVDFKNGRLTIDLEKPHELKPGDKVKIITGKEKILKTVLSVESDYAFTLESEKSYTSVFVYGKEVDDFKTIDLIMRQSPC
jgi:hypothetical protein